MDAGPPDLTVDFESLSERPVETEGSDCGAILGRLGGLVTRLARDDAEVALAQRLRHRVFVEECGAARAGREDGLERDAFDAQCEHLLVVDPSLDGEAGIVGTYRLLRQDVADRGSGFYSVGEFDVGALVARHPERRFLELGRSCVLPAYRDRRTIELLWQGIWAYALAVRADVMFGCASFAGTDPTAHADAFAFLGQHCLADPEWRVPATSGAALPLAEAASGAAGGNRTLASLPPLVKGYLRLGGRVGPDAVVDRDFDCIDVMIVLPREAISPRYISHYGRDARRFA